MATTSQFTIYSSSDFGAPQLYGLTGSLLAVLNACLVTGYGNKAGRGWIKPFADISSSVGPPTLGGFTLPSGSGMSLFVNDAGYHAAALGTEASVVGWEVLSNPSGSYPGIVPAFVSGSLGGGFGQFPTPLQGTSANQALFNGRLVWRKSNAASFAPRYWMMLADAYGFFLHVQTGDAGSSYYVTHFGDIFSYGGTTDRYRCLLYGRTVENSSTVGAWGINDNWDLMESTNYGGSWNHNMTVPCYPYYMPRPWGGGAGSSVVMAKTCDVAKMSGYNQGNMVLAGILPFPNGPDMTIYLSPIVLNDPSTYQLRGRIRGMYQVCHPAANFVDGQVFGGSGEYAGKTFMIVKSGVNGGFWAMEISPTVETN